MFRIDPGNKNDKFKFDIMYDFLEMIVESTLSLTIIRIIMFSLKSMGQF